MKLSQWSSRASLPVLVLLLSMSTLAASAIGWYAMQQGTNAPAAQAGYVLIALAVLAVVLGLATWLTLSRKVLRPLRQAGQVFDRVAAGDLTQRIDIAAQNEVGQLYAALRRLQENIGRSVGSVRAGMELIGAGAQQIVTGNNDLSSRTDEQAAALQQAAASMEQLASTVRQNADSARQANQLAATASEVAQRGGRAVGEVVSTMEDISASSRKISDIVGVIDSIAFQTNILALNAAVEAARAGEQGKGFAVVASEVRALAQRSAHAAKEIKDLIDDSVKKVAAGSEQVERAGATMDEIVTSVARVTDIMGEITAATTEQSSGIDQVNIVVNQMDGVTQQNALLVQNAARSADELHDYVQYVNKAVASFKLSANQVIDVSATPVTSKKAPAATQNLGSNKAARIKSTAAGESAPAKLPSSSKPASNAKPAPALVSPATRASASTSSEDDWEEF